MHKLNEYTEFLIKSHINLMMGVFYMSPKYRSYKALVQVAQRHETNSCTFNLKKEYGCILGIYAYKYAPQLLGVYLSADTLDEEEIAFAAVEIDFLEYFDCQFKYNPFSIWPTKHEGKIIAPGWPADDVSKFMEASTDKKRKAIACRVLLSAVL